MTETAAPAFPSVHRWRITGRVHAPASGNLEHRQVRCRDCGQRTIVTINNAQNGSGRCPGKS